MRRLSIMGLLLVLATGAGCIRLTGPDEVRRQLSRAAGVELQQEIGLTVTRSGVWLARKTLKWADDGEAEYSLKGLRRVEVGIYSVKGRPADGPEPLGIHLFPTEWDPWVRVRENDSEIFVLVKQGDRPEQIRGMLIVVAEADEWIVVRVYGKLERIIEDTLRMAFDQADRPDLYDRTREERDLPPLGDQS